MFDVVLFTMAWNLFLSYSVEAFLLQCSVEKFPNLAKILYTFFVCIMVQSSIELVKINAVEPTNK